MKICAVIAEYNPFHLGHLKHLQYVKQQLHAEKLIVVMSGNFTQRGEPAVMDKFTRARHAILSGADMVIELPTTFATANAETFAKGAIKIIEALGVVDGVCFGIESGEKEDYISLANALNNESKEFKKVLKEKLDQGISLAKAKFETVKELGGSYNEELISSPNNILGLEYTKAILKNQSGIGIYPMIRLGAHNDDTLKKGETSATSIRKVLKGGNYKKLKGNLPKYVYNDLCPYPFGYDKIATARIITASTEFMKTLPDCTEGLENRIKALCKDNLNLVELIEKATTKRYTSSRIKRIILSNLLEIDNKLVKECLDEPLYAKVLAVKGDSKDLISLLSEKSKFPLITRKSDTANLKKTAKLCFIKDVLASDIYNLITDQKINENQMLIID